MAIVAKHVKLIFRKTELNLLRLASEQQPETVHSFRTSTRRLQTLLEQLSSSPNRNQRKLLKLLNRIRKRAGRIRDLDVQLSALRSLKAPLEPRRKTQLMHALIELRRKHEKKLDTLLKKQDIREIQSRLKRAAKDVDVSAGGNPLTTAERLLASVKSADGIDEDTLHRYRITVKRARHIAELAPKSAESEALTGQLRRLQDALGNWHDWFLLTNTASRRLGEINQSSLVALLHNVTRGKYRRAVAELSANSAVRKPTSTGSVDSNNRAGTKAPAPQGARAAAA